MYLHLDLGRVPAGMCAQHILLPSSPAWGENFTSHHFFLRAQPSQSPTLLKIIWYATFAWGADLRVSGATVASDLDLRLTCSSCSQLYITGSQKCMRNLNSEEYR